VYDYSAIYARICQTVHNEPPMLLLYMLLHKNSSFRNYVLSRIDLELLVCVSKTWCKTIKLFSIQVLPILQVLHNGQTDIGGGGGADTQFHNKLRRTNTNDHHMYLALVVLLILTEDEFYCKVVHETVNNCG
jgi:hypothetical protein